MECFKLGLNEVLAFYPEPNANESQPLSLTCTAPLFLFFGNGKTDRTEAEKKAWENGLAQIAASRGASICFIDPAGEDWGEEDAQVYINFLENTSDSSLSDKNKGFSEGIDFFTKKAFRKITGTLQEIYIYGEGSGADFAAAYFLKKIYMETPWKDNRNVTASGCTLTGLSKVSIEDVTDIPVVSLGNSAEINQRLSQKCMNFRENGAGSYREFFESFTGRFRRQSGVLLPFYCWSDEGIDEQMETVSVHTSQDHKGDYAGTKTHCVHYVIYSDEKWKIENTKRPLVLFFHGGGNTALFHAQASEWPLIGKENGFFTAGIDMHFPNCTPSEAIQVIEDIKSKYPIDPGRIYATGFSMGGCKTWELFQEYPEVFAGIAPMCAMPGPGIDSYKSIIKNINRDVAVPVFYVAGEDSPLLEMAFQNERIVKQLAYIFSVNQCVRSYDVSWENIEQWENPIWGINGDEYYEVKDTSQFKGSVLKVWLYKSRNGIYYTALASATHQGHEILSRNSRAAWGFLKHFSRNTAGKICYDL